jgi:DNA-binding NarL/FixJ family response regulator
VLRGALGRLLQRAGYEVLAEVADGQEAVRVALAERPDLVLLDRMMPRIGGIEAARQITVAAPEVRVVIISGQVGTESIAEAGRAGASAFIAKTATHEQMLEILAAVRDGRAHVASDGAGTTIDRAVRRFAARAPAGVALLTPREREVLRLVAEGHSSQGVAAILEIGPRTVESHRQHIMRKLGIHSVAGLTRFALESGNL